MVRKAEKRDLPQIIQIYDSARSYMVKMGNPKQWGDGYPLPALLEEDIARGELYVVCDGADKPHGVFAFPLGDDPSYAAIDGAWLNDNPYGTIHRIAGDGTMPGIFKTSLAFCLGIIPDIRIDTHYDNVVMQRLLETNGFVRCGEVHLQKREDNLRIAYQYQG